MDDRGWIATNGFRLLALLWLPAGVALQAAIRFPPDARFPGDPHLWAAAAMAVAMLAMLAPCGLPLPAPRLGGRGRLRRSGALGCRRLWRPGYRAGAWWAGIGFGAITVAVAVLEGLLGPVAIAVRAVVLSVPVWIGWWWLTRNG